MRSEMRGKGPTLLENVDEVFTRSPAPDEGWVRLFMEQLHASSMEAARSLHGHLLSLLLTWLIAWGIGSGVVVEGEISAFKLTRLRELLIVVPVLLAVFGYLYTLSFCALSTVNAALGRCYKHVLPAAYARDLEQLLRPPLPMNVEIAFQPGQSSRWLRPISFGWVVGVFGVLPFLGPLLAAAHVLVLVWSAGIYSGLAIGASGGVTAIIWLRGALLVVSLNQFIPVGGEERGA